MQELWEQWGQNVHRARMERGLSIRQLASACESHASQISRIERGLRGPNDPLKQRIASALDVNPDELFALSVAA